VDQAFSGVIRQQDVRATEIDKVVLYDCFRPGDVVRCKVLSLGDSRSYYLTTAAEPELGVVHAVSAGNHAMRPVDSATMEDPVTLAREPRLVARTDT
jgi:exosome complex component CSL4